MTRIPPAARQLITEVLAYEPHASAEPTGDPDGYGVHRTIEFDPTTSEWLRPVMDVILDADERIESVHGRKHLKVTFVGDVRADHTDEPFEVADVAAIFAEEQDIEGSVSEPPAEDDDGDSGQDSDDQDQDRAQPEQA